jgi:hypothetical protein
MSNYVRPYACTLSVASWMAWSCLKLERILLRVHRLEPKGVKPLSVPCQANYGVVAVVAWTRSLAVM